MNKIEYTKNDNIEHPKHYTSHPSGIECIQITRHMGFNLGNAIKYIWRADLKNDALEDLEKAIWYLLDEIQKRKSEEQIDFLPSLKWGDSRYRYREFPNSTRTAYAD